MPENFEMEENGQTIAVMHRKKNKFQKILFFGILASLLLILLVLVGNSYFQNKDLKKNRLISLETVLNQTKNIKQFILEMNQQISREMKEKVEANNVNIVNIMSSVSELEREILKKTKNMIENIHQALSKDFLKIKNLSIEIQKTLDKMGNLIREKESHIFDQIDIIIGNITESNSEILKAWIGLEDLENDLENFMFGENKTNLGLEEFIETEMENQTFQVENLKDVLSNKIYKVMNTTNFLETDLNELETDLKKVTLQGKKNNQELRDYSKNLHTNLSLKINDIEVKEEGLKKNIKRTNIELQEIEKTVVKNISQTNAKLERITSDIAGNISKTNTYIKEIRNDFVGDLSLTNTKLEEIANGMVEHFSNSSMVMKEIKGNFSKIVLKTKKDLNNMKEDFEGKIFETNTETKKIKKENENDVSSQNIVNSKINNEIKKVKIDIENINDDKNCKPGWTKYWSKCCKMVKKKSPWSKTLCQSEGGILVIVKDIKMNDFIFSLTSGNTAWLGGHDTKSEGSWEWVDGTSMEHTWAGWRKGEPNDGGRKEDCLNIRSSDKNWNDAPCERTYYYVCQI